MQKVLTCAQMRAADEYTIRTLGVASQELMERAGAAIAEEAETLLSSCGGKKALAVCGGGNNGGDGWCAARLLLEKGYDVSVFSLSKEFSPDCAAQREKFTGEQVQTFLSDADVIIDAIFGTGFHGEPQGEFAEAIRKINQSGAKVVSADIPSGLNGDSGMCSLCVRADVTVAVGELKAGLLLANGADVCGKIVRKDIGIRTGEEAMWRTQAQDFAPLFPPRRKNSNKGNFGKAVILAGSLRYSGAPLLSAAAALRTGCGYTCLALPEELFSACIGKFPEAILTRAPSEKGSLRCDEPFLRSLMAGADCIAVGMGCGVSDGVYDILCFLLREYRGVLLIDADGINALAAYGVQVLENAACKVILTPHPKEFSRLSDCDFSEVLENGVSLAQAFAKEYGCTVLLKGNTSVITDGKEVLLNTEGTPALAKGGSGDVLSGIIAAIAARGVSPLQAAACGAFLLGRAGEYAAREKGEYSVIGTDVTEKLPQAILSLQV